MDQITPITPNHYQQWFKQEKKNVFIEVRDIFGTHLLKKENIDHVHRRAKQILIDVYMVTLELSFKKIQASEEIYEAIRFIIIGADKFQHNGNIIHISSNEDETFWKMYEIQNESNVSSINTLKEE